MISSNSNIPVEFTKPKTIRLIVCCDLDETYIPHSDSNKKTAGINELEAFIEKVGITNGLLIGWVTGTNLSSAIRKANGYITRSPHFICCSLGTEFYWVSNGSLVESHSWNNRILESGYNEKNVEKIVNNILKHNISIEKQPDDYQGKFKKSYYYYVGNKLNEDFEFIEDLANQYNVRVIFTKCNPAAGDPENCYDVEFIPTCCGKDEAVKFLIEETSLNKESVIAFGDSANDFSMFKQAGKGYLVSNADKFAIEKHGSCLSKPYCHGILDVLKGVV